MIGEIHLALEICGSIVVAASNPAHAIVLATLAVMGLALVLFIVQGVYLFVVASMRRIRGRCRNCGYDLRGASSLRCSECGARING